MTILTWHEALSHCQTHAQAYVLVTLLDTMGSTPRASGTKMLVCEETIHDTLGGGHLEFAVCEKARALLATGKDCQHIEHYPLSSKLGQCCGGATIVLFEVFASHEQSLVIFGAGHVAKALVPILAQLPLNITWVDQRQEMFESAKEASNIKNLVTDTPASLIPTLAPNTWILILTHNHQLDFELVCAALKHNKLDYLGMIGSETKARRFRTRLQHREIEQQKIDKLICPVGLKSVQGKRPIEVAVSISGQIIQMLEQPASSANQLSKQWLTTKKLLESS